MAVKKTDGTKKITADTKMGEVMTEPDMVPILVRYGFPCLGCPHAAAEMDKLTIGDICGFYNLELEGLLEELNGKSGAAGKRPKGRESAREK
ncbi:MAG: DUF1858 domain-containing protein [Candidatus Bilamarchaeaceae archaeon]